MGGVVLSSVQKIATLVNMILILELRNISRDYRDILKNYFRNLKDIRDMSQCS